MKFSEFVICNFSVHDSPVGCTLTEGAVQRRGLRGRPGGLIAAVLWGPGLMLAVGGHGAQTSQAYGEPVITAWSSGLSIETTLSFEIWIHTEDHCFMQSQSHWCRNVTANISIWEESVMRVRILKTGECSLVLVAWSGVNIKYLKTWQKVVCGYGPFYLDCW